MKKKITFISLGIIFLVGIVFYVFYLKKVQVSANRAINTFSTSKYINEEGLTVTSRVKIPKGYKQVAYPKGSFEEYIQNYPLKKFGSKIINYDKSTYFFQSGHFGILELPVPKNGLQQCADALIRLRAEYLWETNQKDKIGFEFTSGHYCSWKEYAKGYRPKVRGNKVSFHKTANANTSKENFYKYLNLIFTYSGTLSLFTELSKITKTSELQLGDMLVVPGTPGHIVLLVDEIENKDGEKLFVLAQGNTPAQNVHLLKNPRNRKLSPWYDLEVNAYTEIPGYYFSKAKFIRFKE